MLKKFVTIAFICCCLFIASKTCQGIIDWYNAPGTVWGPEIIENVTLTVTEITSGGSFKAIDPKTGEEFKLSMAKTSNARKLRVNEDQITLVRIRKFATNNNEYKERFQDVKKTVNELVKGR